MTLLCNKYCTHRNVTAHCNSLYSGFANTNPCQEVYSSLQQNSFEYKRMHWNKLQSTLIFKSFQGKYSIPLCRRGYAPLQHPARQDRRYRDEIVLRQLNNLILLFYNLKILRLGRQKINNYSTSVCWI